jgi:hypothetical protein
MALATGFGLAVKPEAGALPLTRIPDSHFFGDPKFRQVL